MQKRINITLPEETIRLIDRVADNRSQFINRAVRRYVEEVGRSNLRQRLKQGAIRRVDRDLRLVEEWFQLEEEAGQKSEP